MKTRAARAIQLSLSAERPQRRTGSVRRQFLTIVTAAVASFAVALQILTSSDESHNAAAQCSGGITAVTSADTNVAHATRLSSRPRLVRQVDIGARPTALAVSREGIWVTSREGVSLIDPKSYSVLTTIPVGGPAFGIAVSGERVWVTRRDGRLVSIDRSERQLIGRPIAYGTDGGDVAVGGGSVWVNNYSANPNSSLSGTVSRIDGCSRKVKRIRVGIEADTVRFGFGSLWITDSVRGAVVRLDPRDDRVTTAIRGFNDPSDLAIGAKGVWVTEFSPARLRLIDAATSRLTETAVEVGSGPSGIAVDGQAVWVASYDLGRLTAVPLLKPSDITKVERIGSAPTDVALGFDRVWVANNSSTTVSVVRP